MRRKWSATLALVGGGWPGRLPPIRSAGGASELRPGVPAEVFVAPGRATTIQLQTEQRVAAISLASPVVTYQYDKALNQLEITPAAHAGGTETNLNLRIGPNVYILVVKVVTDVRAQFLRSFVLAGEAAADDEAALAQVRPAKPAEVDLIGAVRTIERAQADPVFRAAQPMLRLESLDRSYQWNGCLVTLADEAQFLDRDLLVFRVQWMNRTDTALYLDPVQYGLFIGERPIPVIARYKVGVGPVIYPGQLETVYLAVQGFRLSRHNDWRLALPPEAAAVERMGWGSPVNAGSCKLEKPDGPPGRAGLSLAFTCFRRPGRSAMGAILDPAPAFRRGRPGTEG